MATLSRWKKYTPKWLGNAESPQPFSVEVKRATWGERRAFLLSLQAEDATDETRAAMFLPLLRGPIGDLVIDGERVSTIERLVQIALDEPNDDGNLFAELVGAVLDGSALGKAMREPSVLASGGSGTSAAEEAPPAPTALAVAASSPVVTTTSAGAKASPG